MAACALAGGIFWGYSQWLATPSPENLKPFLDRVNTELVQAAKEGRTLTLVIGDPEASKNPLLLTKRVSGIWGRILGEKNNGDFVVRLGKAGFPLGWNPIVRLDPNNKELLEPFARMLVTAGEAGVPIRIMAQGEAVAFVLHAAEASGAPQFKVVVAAGVRLGDIKARKPRDTVAVWIDPDIVPPSLNVETEMSAFERDPGYDTWEEILIRALKGGALALKPRKLPKASSSRPLSWKKGKPKPTSGLQMLQKDVAMLDPESESTKEFLKKQFSDKKLFHRLGNTGWFIKKENLRGIQIQYDNNGLSWYHGSGTQEAHRIRLHTGYNETRGVCGKSGHRITRSNWKGYPVDICSEVPSQEVDLPDGFTEHFTIVDGDAIISIQYRYAPGTTRDKYASVKYNIIGALIKK